MIPFCLWVDKISTQKYLYYYSLAFYKKSDKYEISFNHNNLLEVNVMW